MSFLTQRLAVPEFLHPWPLKLIKFEVFQALFIHLNPLNFEAFRALFHVLGPTELLISSYFYVLRPAKQLKFEAY